MIHLVQLEVEPISSFPSFVECAILDMPQDGNVLEGDEIRFRGWVLKNNSVKFFLEYDSEQRIEVNLNCRRDDVMQIVKKIFEPTEEEAMVGFSFIVKVNWYGKFGQ